MGLNALTHQHCKHSKLIIKGDCQEVVSHVNGILADHYPVNSQAETVLARAKTLMTTLRYTREVTLIKIPRSQNSAANKLARQAAHNR